MEEDNRKQICVCYHSERGTGCNIRTLCRRRRRRRRRRKKKRTDGFRNQSERNGQQNHFLLRPQLSPGKAYQLLSETDWLAFSVRDIKINSLLRSYKLTLLYNCYTERLLLWKQLQCAAWIIHILLQDVKAPNAVIAAERSPGIHWVGRWVGDKEGDVRSTASKHF